MGDPTLGRSTVAEERRFLDSSRWQRHLMVKVPNLKKKQSKKKIGDPLLSGRTPAFPVGLTVLLLQVQELFFWLLASVPLQKPPRFWGVLCLCVGGVGWTLASPARALAPDSGRLQCNPVQPVQSSFPSPRSRVACTQGVTPFSGPGRSEVKRNPLRRAPGVSAWSVWVAKCQNNRNGRCSRRRRCRCTPGCRKVGCCCCCLLLLLELFLQSSRNPPKKIKPAWGEPRMAPLWGPQHARGVWIAGRELPPAPGSPGAPITRCRLCCFRAGLRLHRRRLPGRPRGVRAPR